MHNTLYVRIVLFLSCSFLISYVYSQNAKIDSLENLLKEYINEDTARVNLLNESSKSFIYIDLEKSFAYAKEALDLADSLNYKIGKILSLINIGQYYAVLSDYEQAINSYEQAILVSEQNNDKESVARCLNYIGVIYAKQSNYPLTLDYFLKSLKIEEEINDKWGISASLNNIGVIYNFKGNYDLALEYFNKALKIKDELNDKQGMAKCFNNMGIAYKNLKKIPLSLEYYQKSLKINREIGNKTEIANCLQNIGIIYINQDKVSNAFINFNESLKIHEEINNLYGISSLKLNISDAYLKENNFNKALSYSLQSLTIAEEKEFLNIQTENYLLQSKIYFELNNYKRAYETLLIFKEFEDSIYNKENIEKITQLEYQYKYEKDKQAIALEQQKKDAIYQVEQKRQAFIRNTLLVGFILVLFLSGAIFYNLVQKRKANKLLSKQKKDIEDKNYRLKEQNEEIQQLNEELQVSNEMLYDQKNELEMHRNNLENLVKERTSDLVIAKEKAEESDRLKSAFLANMSHEIRTPMNAIVGFTSLLNDPELTDETKEELTDHINHNTDILLKLIEDIIDIAKIESGQLKIINKEVSVYQIVEAVIPLYDDKKINLNKNEVTFKVIKSQKDIMVKTDPLRLQQILINLLNNAFKFTEKGDIELGFELVNHSSQKKILFFVKDTGIGISEEQTAIIFKRFSKIEEDKTKLFRGAGLGLTISKNIVELLGGKLWVESEIGKGSKFIFTIPISN